MSNAQDLQALYHAQLNKMQALRDQMAAQGLIVKDEPFAPVYIHITRALMAARDRQGLHVLLEIANHADEMGWCFPSVQTIGKATGYSPGTVEAALSRLMVKDWLRVSMVYNQRRKRIEKDFVLSPAVLFIRPEIRETAWSRYQEVGQCDSYEKLKYAVTQYIKPVTEPASATITKNQNHQPEPEPAPAASRNVEKLIDPETVGNEVSNSAPAQSNLRLLSPNENDSDSAQNSVSNSAAIPTGHNPPPVPAHPPLPPEFDPSEALPDAQDEQTAQRIHSMFTSLQLRVARQYVARYDRDMVLLTAQIAAAAPHIRNPVGKLDSDLRRSLTDPQDKSTENSRFTSGQDANFIET